MGFYLDPIRNAMSFLGVRKSGGQQGVHLTDGIYNEYVWDLNAPNNTQIKFPTGNGISVCEVILAYATGTVTALTIGGVSITAATDAAPVSIPEGNSGVLAQTGATAGKIVIKYFNLEGDATHNY